MTASHHQLPRQAQARSVATRRAVWCLGGWVALMTLLGLTGTVSVGATWAAIACLCLLAAGAAGFFLRARRFVLAVLAVLLVLATAPALIGLAYWLGAP